MGVKLRIITLPSHLAIVYERLLKVVPPANLPDLNLIHLCAQRYVKINERNWKLRKRDRAKAILYKNAYIKSEHGKAVMKRWMENNKAKRTEYQRNWREKNRDHVNAKAREFRRKKKLENSRS
jgi:hypothetical protein